MADLAVEYDSILTVSGLLKGAETSIAPQISALHSQVDALLTQDGGLWLNSSSPAMQQQYETFNTQAQNCVDSIGSFATMFQQLAASLQSMDTSMAYSINHPSSS